MTVSIPAVTFPAARTVRDMTGRLVASGLVVIMSGPARPRQPACPSQVVQGPFGPMAA